MCSSFCGRSFSIWSTDGELVFDSGRDFELITAQVSPDTFNSEGDAATFNERSDDMGPKQKALPLAR
ncbi:MAG: hypothetical protein WA996_20915 [Candidatus Promineifilaceae bacterium]